MLKFRGSKYQDPFDFEKDVRQLFDDYKRFFKDPGSEVRARNVPLITCRSRAVVDVSVFRHNGSFVEYIKAYDILMQSKLLFSLGEKLWTPECLR